jgi:hypothetical protein
MAFSILTGLLGFVGLVAVGIWIFVKLRRPSLDRDWSPDQAIMPEVKFTDGGKVQIKNIRNASYRTTRDYDLTYYDREIAIDDVESAWLAIAPFAGMGAAHAFISFGLKDGTYISVSIEIRREKGERFTPVKAFLRQFEMMYVIADERDVVRVRTNCAKFIVRLYPIQTDKALIRDVFCDVLKRADKLGREPEFYNTLWNNCTTNIIKHTRRFSKKPIPVWSYRYLFPDTLDKIAWRLSILDTDMDYHAAREHFNITPIAQAFDDGAEFSKAIREPILKPQAAE